MNEHLFSFPISISVVSHIQCFARTLAISGGIEERQPLVHWTHSLWWVSLILVVQFKHPRVVCKWIREYKINKKSFGACVALCWWVVGWSHLGFCKQLPDVWRLCCKQTFQWPMMMCCIVDIIIIWYPQPNVHNVALRSLFPTNKAGVHSVCQRERDRDRACDRDGKFRGSLKYLASALEWSFFYI